MSSENVKYCGENNCCIRVTIPMTLYGVRPMVLVIRNPDYKRSNDSNPNKDVKKPYIEKVSREIVRKNDNKK